MDSITQFKYQSKFQFLIANAKLQLNDHQVEGVMWCIANEIADNPTGNVRGGILADEMGLGKTILMIGTMYAHFLRHTLIVVPPVLMQQWRTEIYKITGHTPLVYHGINKQTTTLQQLQHAPIVITTYSTLLLDKLLPKIKWNRIIYDEAHHLRNSKTKRFQAHKNMRAGVRWLVTGTPMQNKQDDLISLYDMLGFSQSHYENAGALAKLRQSFILRRTKKQVGIQMPALNVTMCNVAWATQTEKRFAEEIHALMPNQTKVPTDKCGDYAHYCKYQFEKPMFYACLRARQACIAPNIMADHIHYLANRRIIPPAYRDTLAHSSKLDAVIAKIVEHKNDGRGKLVFCHYKREIDTISHRLKHQHGFDNVYTYDGRQSKKQLATIINKAFVIILQIQIGCEGLNLQKNFSQVYFVSPHWNPAVEDQAIARCHRMGQTTDVNVYRFIMEGFNENPDPDKEETISLEQYVQLKQMAKSFISNKLLA